MSQNEMTKRKTDSYCFAPGCRSGYPGAPRASLFSAPKDEELRKKWQQNLRRQDKPLSEWSAVCERHFEPHLVLKDYVHVVNGSEVRIPRGRPRLAPNAIPTLLPGCPGLPTTSASTTTRRPVRKRSSTTSASRKRSRNLPNSEVAPHENGAAEEPDNEPFTIASAPHENEAAEEPDSEPFTIASVDELPLPSKRWHKLETDGYTGVIFATTTVQKAAKLEIVHDKAVCFNTFQGKVFAQVFVRGVMCSDGAVLSLSEAGDVFLEAEDTHICRGAVTKSDFVDLEQCLTPELRAATIASGQSVFSTACEGKVPTKGTACTECKAVRKALLTAKSSKKRKACTPRKGAVAVQLKPKMTKKGGQQKKCTTAMKKGRAANGSKQQKHR